MCTGANLLTDDAMKLGASFSGFDFDNVWTINSNYEYPYPQLRDNIQSTAKVIDSIAWRKTPSKIKYYIGEGLDISSGSIRVYYVDGTSEVIALTSDKVTVTGFDSTTVGAKTLTVTHRGKTLEYQVEIIEEPEIASVEEVSGPNKTEFVKGTSLDYTGWVVQVNYVDGTTRTINVKADATTGVDNSKTGKYVAEYTYGSYTFQKDITITPVLVTGIKVKKAPTKTSYILGETVSMDGLKVALQYNDGTSKVTTDYKLGEYKTNQIGTQSVAVSYSAGEETYTDYFDITIEKGTAVKLNITSQPTKTQYVEGEKFDTKGMTVTAEYSNGVVLPITDYECSEIGPSLGQQTIVVSYRDVTADVTINVIEKTLQSIELSHLPNKTQYTQGQEVDKTGLVITATYNDGSKKTVNDYTIAGFNTNTLGSHTVAITYGGYSVNFTIKVNEAESTSIFVDDSEMKKIYLAGDELDTAGLIVKANYNNGTTKVIEDYEISGFTGSVGMNLLTISFEGLECTVPVYVHIASGKWVVVDKPSCTTKGKRVQYCSDCGEIAITEEIAALGHDFGEWEIVEDSTCSKGGYKARTCKVCEYVETQEIDKKDHAWDTDYTIDKKASCTEDGSKSIHCKNCEAVKNATVIKATGHIEKAILIKATVDTDGLKKTICDTCKEILDNTVIPKIKSIILLEDEYVYDGSEKKPGVIILDSANHQLIEGTDYTVEYKNNTEAGTAKAVVTFEGNYDGAAIKEFTIKQATPEYTLPSGLTATYGDKLNSIDLPEGFTWANGKQSVGNAGTNTFKVTYTPADTEKYRVVKDIDVQVEVAKAIVTAGALDTLEAICNETLSQIALPDGYSWNDGTQSVGTASSNVKYFKATFKATDTANYKDNTDVTVGIRVKHVDSKTEITKKASTTEAGTIRTYCEACNTTLKEETIPQIAIHELAKTSVKYDGSEKKPALIIKDSEGNALAEGKDYELAYTDNVNVGTASVTIAYKGRYTGEEILNFEITKSTGPEVTLSKDEYTYDGTQKKPAVTVKNGGKTLAIDSDYSVEYSDNVKAGTAKATVTLIGNYEGTIEKSYIIVPADNSKVTVSLGKSTAIYTGSEIKPVVTVTGIESETLAEGEDYTVTYSDNTNVGTATATVSLIGNYSGSKTQNFSILQTDGTALSLQLSDNEYVYDGSAKTPHPIITGADGKELTKDKDFTVDYSNNKNAGTATATINFKGNYSGTVQKTFTIKALSVDVELLQSSFKYKGKAIEPEIELQASAGITPIEGTDYTVSYSDNNAPGTGHVTVTFSGNYSGTIDKEFEIIRTYNIEGSVAGCGTENEAEITIKDAIGSETKVTTTDGKYSFKWLDAGNYTITVKGTGDYVTREYTKTLDNDYTENLEIYQLGDTTCNGVRSAEDITALARHIAKISVEIDSYKLKLFDTNRSNSLEAADITHLARYVAKIIEAL